MNLFEAGCLSCSCQMKQALPKGCESYDG